MKNNLIIMNNFQGTAMETRIGLVSKFLIIFSCTVVGDQISLSFPVLDICGGAANYSTSGSPQTSGYIISPGYPSDYPDNIKCTCTLVGINDSLITLDVLDYDLVPIPNEALPDDWLEYTWRDDQDWGEGLRIGSGTKSLKSGSTTVRINFHTNAKLTARGFRIKYTGALSDATSNGSVYGECSGYTPPDYLRASGCIEQSHATELYLSCPRPGVINIMRVYLSSSNSSNGISSSGSSKSSDGSSKSGSEADYMNNSTNYKQTFSSSQDHTGGPGELKTEEVQSRLCPAAPSDLCYESLYRVDSVLNQCMHQADCLYSVRASSVPMCHQQSDYMHVDYYCIPFDHNSMDICGEDHEPGTILQINSGEGYINSPDYPSHYPPDTDCQCHLVSTDDTTQITLFLFDVQLDNATLTEIGQGDKLEFWTDSQTGSMSYLLNEVRVNSPIYTGSSSVNVRLKADSSQEQRGFWMKYTARTVDGLFTPLQIRCHHAMLADPGYPTASDAFSASSLSSDTTLHGTSADIDPSIDSGDSNRQRKDLVVGLSVLSGLLIIFLIVLVVHLCSRRHRDDSKASNSEDNSPTGSISSTHQLSSGRTTLPSLGRGWKTSEGKGLHGGKGPNSPDYYTMTAFQSIGYKHNDPTRYRRDVKPSDASCNSTFRL